MKPTSRELRACDTCHDLYLPRQQGVLQLYCSERCRAKHDNDLRRNHPGINIVGGYSPPFRELTAEEEDEVVAGINVARPDVVWVGIGVPKQEKWMAHMRDRLDAPVICAVGAAFDFLSGEKAQAPYWMQRSGLEWAFRLATEPRRLARRYIVDNSVFVLRAIQQRSGLKSYAQEW